MALIELHNQLLNLSLNHKKRLKQNQPLLQEPPIDMEPTEFPNQQLKLKKKKHLRFNQPLSQIDMEQEYNQQLKK